MVLRPVSDLGMSDATDVARPEQSASPPPRRTTSAAAKTTRRRTRREPSTKSQSASPGTTVARPAVALADQPTTFVQIMVPGELHERLAETSHALGAEHRKLRHHKTILGALVWRYVHPEDAQRMRELGSALDAYLNTDVSEAPAEIKVGAHLPFSLKYALDGAALALRRTRRTASAKTLLSALIVRDVDPSDVSELVELLAAYHKASRPQPAPLP